MFNAKAPGLSNRSQEWKVISGACYDHQGFIHLHFYKKRQWNRKWTFIHPADATCLKSLAEKALRSKIGKRCSLRWHRNALYKNNPGKKKLKLGWSVYRICHRHLTLHRQIITYFDRCKTLWWRKKKTFSNEIQIQDIVKKYIFTSKLAEFYWKVIEEFLDKWQHIIAHNGDYLIEKKQTI